MVPLYSPHLLPPYGTLPELPQQFPGVVRPVAPACAPHCSVPPSPYTAPAEEAEPFLQLPPHLPFRRGPVPFWFHREVPLHGVGCPSHSPQGDSSLTVSVTPQISAHHMHPVLCVQSSGRIPHHGEHGHSCGSGAPPPTIPVVHMAAPGIPHSTTPGVAQPQLPIAVPAAVAAAAMSAAPLMPAPVSAPRSHSEHPPAEESAVRSRASSSADCCEAASGSRRDAAPAVLLDLCGKSPANTEEMTRNSTDSDARSRSQAVATWTAPACLDGTCTGSQSSCAEILPKHLGVEEGNGGFEPRSELSACAQSVHNGAVAPVPQCRADEMMTTGVPREREIKPRAQATVRQDEYTLGHREDKALIPAENLKEECTKQAEQVIKTVPEDACKDDGRQQQQQQQQQQRVERGEAIHEPEGNQKHEAQRTEMYEKMEQQQVLDSGERHQTSWQQEHHQVQAQDLQQLRKDPEQCQQELKDQKENERQQEKAEEGKQ